MPADPARVNLLYELVKLGLARQLRDSAILYLDGQENQRQRNQLIGNTIAPLADRNCSTVRSLQMLMHWDGMERRAVRGNILCRRTRIASAGRARVYDDASLLRSIEHT